MVKADEQSQAVVVLNRFEELPRGMPAGSRLRQKVCSAARMKLRTACGKTGACPDGFLRVPERAGV
jgi:hypothetical protein